MKTTYHIKVKGDEHRGLCKAFDHLGVEYHTAVVMGTLDDTIWDFIIDLSKYEFLYLRLACSGEFRIVPKQKQQTMSLPKQVQQV